MQPDLDIWTASHAGSGSAVVLMDASKIANFRSVLATFCGQEMA
jgi:hypothetical protein